MIYSLGTFARTIKTITSLISIPTATAAANVKNVMIYSLAKLRKVFQPSTLIGQFQSYICKPNKFLMSTTITSTGA